MHLCLLLCLLAQSHDPDEASLSSSKPKIPEPMVFDLVRPLGAARGELEANSLFRAYPRRPGRTLRWAPEVEYTFANGWGVEFEIPMENRHVESTKAALQGTLPGSIRHRSIHGVQAIWEDLRDVDGGQTDILYLFGYRFNKRWSAFSMNGVRSQWNGTANNGWLSNQTLFFQPNRKVVFGLETNYQAATLDARSLLAMPQVHWKRGRLNLQVGGGAYFTKRTQPVMALRVSREF